MRNLSRQAYSEANMRGRTIILNYVVCLLYNIYMETIIFDIILSSIIIKYQTYQKKVQWYTCLQACEGHHFGYWNLLTTSMHANTVVLFSWFYYFDQILQDKNLV